MRCAKRMYYQSNAIVVYTCIYVIHWETPYIIPAGRKLYSSTNMASPKDAERLALCSLKTTQDEICLKRYWDEPRLYDPRYGQRRIADSQKLSIRNLLICSSPCAQVRVQVKKPPILFAFAGANASAMNIHVHIGGNRLQSVDPLAWQWWHRRDVRISSRLKRCTGVVPFRTRPPVSPKMEPSSRVYLQGRQHVKVRQRSVIGTVSVPVFLQSLS